MFSTFSHRLSIVIEIVHILTKYVQSRLLQNCRMREKVKLQQIFYVARTYFDIVPVVEEEIFPILNSGDNLVQLEQFK